MERLLLTPPQLPWVALNWSPQELERRFVIADDRHFKRRLSFSFEPHGFPLQLNIVNLHGVLLGRRIDDRCALAVGAIHICDAHRTGHFVSTLAKLQDNELRSIGTDSLPCADERL